MGAFLYSQKESHTSLINQDTQKPVFVPINRTPKELTLIKNKKDEFFKNSKKSFDGSWSKVNFKKEKEVLFKSKENFIKDVLSEYPFLLDDLPKGVKISGQTFNETANSNIIIWKYSFNGVPYPGQKVFFFKKEDQSLGHLFQINNDVPILLEFNKCRAMNEDKALKIVQGLHKSKLSNIKINKMYFPDSGQTASLGYEFTYDLPDLNNSFLVAIDACKGNLIKGPLSILEH